MARYKSRRIRRDEATSTIGEAISELEELAADLRGETGPDDESFTVESVTERFNIAQNKAEEGKSALEELKDEIESWKDNMEGANMEHLPKYDEVSEAYDGLESSVDAYESIDWPDIKEDFSLSNGEDRDALADDMEAAANELQSLVDDAENVDFPGMFR